MSGKQEEERDGAQKNINRGSWKMNRVICAGIRRGASSLEERKVKREMVFTNRVTRVMLTALGIRICALLCVCVEQKATAGPAEFPHLH